MDYHTSERLLSFLDSSYSVFHAIENVKDILLANEYTQLKEDESWYIKLGGKYFVVRNDSSLIAFTIPDKDINGYRIVATHSDFPTFKVKENPENNDGKYIRINVEPYGGAIYNSWLDRSLSVAGRVLVKEDEKYVTKLVNVDKDFLIIPNLAIHMNRKTNDGQKFDPKKDMLPIYATSGAEGTFMTQIAQQAKVYESDILGHDLFLYNRDKGKICGGMDEFICSGRIDNLQCTFAALMGFIMGAKNEHGSILCVFDNEEVGSSTKQGANSMFLSYVLERIGLCLNLDREEQMMNLAKSFMISADNAHGYHPSHPEVCDGANSPMINQGVVIKYNANQKYCTDGVSAAMFKDMCKDADVPYQIYTNRADMPGGSTLGSIANTKASINTIDVGLPQLAMHSSYETAGIKDTEYLIKVINKFYK